MSSKVFIKSHLTYFFSFILIVIFHFLALTYPFPISVNSSNTIKISSQLVLNVQVKKNIKEKKPRKKKTPIKVSKTPFLKRAVKKDLNQAFSKAKSKHTIQANYPLVSKKLGEEGVTTISVVIDSQGKPLQSEIIKSSGFYRLDSAALQAIKKAEFFPATSQFNHVKSKLVLTFSFVLKNKS